MLVPNILIYIFPFILSLILAIIFTLGVKKLALRWGILDVPGAPRRIHKRPIPKLGGIAAFLSFAIVMLLVWQLGWLADGIMKSTQLWGIMVGGLVLMVAGFLDDKFNLKPWQFFLFTLLATALAVAFGIAVKYITNPLMSGTGPYGRALFYFNWVDLKIISFSSLFSFLWILGMIYTTKFLDGLDGLATGVGAIGALILFVVSLFWNVPMSGVSILCLILAGSLLGFLVFNFNPAKIFLGESGATFIGFMLGVLSIISGGKIATALLIMGIPILDVVWVIFRRLFIDKKHIFDADRKHLHFRLLDIGLSQRQVVLFLYLLTVIFGSSSLFLQSQYKIVSFGVLTLVTIIMGVFLVRKNKVNSDQ